MNLEQLKNERERLLRVRSCVEDMEKRAQARFERLREIESTFPLLIIQVAEGECDESTLDEAAAEIARLRAIPPEPVGEALTIIDGQLQQIVTRVCSINKIQKERDDDLEFRKLFNRIARTGDIDAGEQRKLEVMGNPTYREEVKELVNQAWCFKRRSKPSLPVRIADIITVPLFSEEPDTSPITA